MTETAKPSPASATIDERRAAKVKELKKHLEGLSRTRSGFTVIAVALLAISPLGLMADGLVTFGIATVAVCMFAVSAYLSFIYIRDTRDKISRLEPKSRSPKP